MLQSAFRKPISACVRVALTLMAVVLIAGVAHACPTCSEGLANADPHHQSVAAGYFYSILFMMSMPFAILGTFCGLAYISIRRARERQALEVGEESDG
jgi:hypothetical protein